MNCASYTAWPCKWQAWALRRKMWMKSYSARPPVLPCTRAQDPNLLLIWRLPAGRKSWSKCWKQKLAETTNLHRPAGFPIDFNEYMKANPERYDFVFRETAWRTCPIEPLAMAWIKGRAICRKSKGGCDDMPINRIRKPTNRLEGYLEQPAASKFQRQLQRTQSFEPLSNLQILKGPHATPHAFIKVGVRTNS